MIEVPIKSPKKLELSEINKEDLATSLTRLELFSLNNQIPSFVASFSNGGYKANKGRISTNQSHSKVTEKRIEGVKLDENNSNQLPKITPQIIQDPFELKVLVDRLLKCNSPLSPVAVDTETTDLNPFKSELVGIGFCWGEDLDQIAYIPLGHNAHEELKLNGNNSINSQLLSLIHI